VHLRGGWQREKRSLRVKEEEYFPRVRVLMCRGEKECRESIRGASLFIYIYYESAIYYIRVSMRERVRV